MALIEKEEVSEKRENVNANPFLNCRWLFSYIAGDLAQFIHYKR